MSYNIDDDHFWGIKARREVARMQPFLRSIATFTANHKRCTLPKCRRAKQCLGCHKDDEIGTTHWKSFPPCVDTPDRQVAQKKGIAALLDQMREAARAAGEDMEAWENFDSDIDPWGD